MALIGRMPSCGANLSYKRKNKFTSTTTSLFINVSGPNLPTGLWFSYMHICHNTYQQTCNNTYRHHFAFPGIAHSEATVLAGGTEKATIVVPADIVDEIRMVIHCDQGFSSAHIPDDDQIITA